MTNNIEEQGKQQKTNEEVVSTGDFKDRILKFLEEEGESIRKETYQESLPIVNKAREAYRKRLGKFLEEERERTIKQAKLEALEQVKEEADGILLECRQKLIPELEREKDQMLENANQEASLIIDKANKESETIVDEARHEAEQIVAEAKKQAKEMIERIVKDVTKNLSSELEKSVELVTGAQQKLGSVIKTVETESEKFDQQNEVLSEITDLNQADEESTFEVVSGEEVEEADYQIDVEKETSQREDNTQIPDSKEQAPSSAQRMHHWQKRW